MTEPIQVVYSTFTLVSVNDKLMSESLQVYTFKHFETENEWSIEGYSLKKYAAFYFQISKSMKTTLKNQKKKSSHSDLSVNIFEECLRVK